MGTSRRGDLVVGGAALALSLSLLLPWYSVRRPAALGPANADGWQAFTHLDVAICGAGVIALLAPAFLPPAISRAAAAACGLGGGLLAIWTIVHLGPVPPVATAAPTPGNFVRADGVHLGPYVAALAGGVLALAAALDARRMWERRLELAWPSETTMVAGLTALAGLLRFATLGEQSYWYDELATVETLRPGLHDAVDVYMNLESTPPLYYVIAWPWAHLAGTGEYALRSLSALIGTVTVPVAYLAGRRLVSGRAGVMAAALVAVNPTLVWYSQEARAYSLLVLTCAVTLVLLARALSEPTTRNVALWAVSAALALATHYFALFIVATEGLVLAYRSLRVRPAALLPAIGLGVAGLALVPLAHAQGGASHTKWIAGIPLDDRVTAIAKELISANTLVINQNTTVPTAKVGYAVAAVILLAVLAAGVMVFRRRQGSGAALPVLLGAGALLIPLVLTQADNDYLLDRNLLPAWIALAVGLGAALAVLPRWAGGLALAGVVAAGLFVDVDVATKPALQRADWRDGVALLGQRAQGRAIVVTPSFARGMVPFYGVDAAPLPAGGVRTSEVDVIGNFAVAGPYPSFAGFAPVRARELPQIGVVELRSARPVLITPATALANHVDPAAVMVQASVPARAWVKAYLNQLQTWREALSALDRDAGRGRVDSTAASILVRSARADREALLPVPDELPQAGATTRLMLSAAQAGAGWAASLSGARADPTRRRAVSALAERFDDAIRRVPGAAAALGARSAAAITRKLLS